MRINELLAERNMTKHRLSKENGVVQTTVADICSGKSRIEKYSAETLYRIAKTLGVTMELLLESSMEYAQDKDYRTSFEVFKSQICHLVKGKNAGGNCFNWRGSGACQLWLSSIVRL